MSEVGKKTDASVNRVVNVVLNSVSTLYSDAIALLSPIFAENDSIRVIHSACEDETIVFTLSADGSGLINYRTLPEQNEWQPFLHIIRAFSTTDEYAEEWVLDDEASKEKIHCIVAIAQVCPHCAEVVRVIGSFISHNSHLSADIVDVTRSSDYVTRYDIQSTPTVIINDCKTFVGAVLKTDIAAYLNATDTTERHKCRVGFFLSNNFLDEAVKIITEYPETIDFITDTLQSSILSKRVQAMTLLEELMEDEPELCRTLVEPLLGLLTIKDITILSDIIYALGVIGDKRSEERLKRFLNHENEDVREGAKDALDEIDGT